jgi:hypothetical protein
LASLLSTTNEADDADMMEDVTTDTPGKPKKRIKLTKEEKIQKKEQMLFGLGV